MFANTYLAAWMAGAALLCAAGLAFAWRRLRTFQKLVPRLQHDMAEMEMAYANAPLGLAMLDRELRYIRINKLLAQLNGLSVQAHIGKTIREVVPDVAPQAEAPFLHVIRTGEPLLGMVFEGVTAARPGVRCVWRENVYPIFAGDGSVIGINVAVEDITEETRLNAALKESELRERQRASELEAVMHATPAAIFIARDVACSRVVGNAEANRMLRLQPEQNASAQPSEERARRPFTEYIDGVPARPDQLPMQRAAATGKEVRGVELSYHFADGDVSYALANAAPLLNGAGTVTGAVGAFIDVTAQKQAAQLVLRESRRKDEFLATLAHELRNPLASIQSGLELMKLTPLASPPLARTRDIMARQSSHLVRLIDDLLDVSRISAGKLELKKDNITVQAIIDNALEMSRHPIEASGHRLDIVLPREALDAQADLVRMAQVISNLLNNAAKYTPEGGHIRLEAQRNGTCAEIRVIDNGIGIERDMLPKVFDLFSQVENGRTRRQGGIGVGLSLARQLVELHGGTLTAESAGAGRGSTFTVRLPLVDAATPACRIDAPRRPAPAVPKSSRILILDDNADAALMLGALFEAGGHAIRLAGTGREAIAAARQFQPEIAFLDIGLPDMSGLEVAQALRNEHSLQRTTLVALTGWGSDQDRRESREAGFDFHLTKPVTLESIREILPDLNMPVAH